MRGGSVPAVAVLLAGSAVAQMPVTDSAGRLAPDAYLRPAYTVAGPMVLPSQNFAPSPELSPPDVRPPQAVVSVPARSTPVVAAAIECGPAAVVTLGEKPPWCEPPCVGPGLFGQPTLYVPGQPIANALRALGL